MKYDRHQDSPTSNASPESSIAAQYTPLFYIPYSPIFPLDNKSPINSIQSPIWF